jgi:hypothetical protein
LSIQIDNGKSPVKRTEYGNVLDKMLLEVWKFRVGQKGIQPPWRPTGPTAKLM